MIRYRYWAWSSTDIDSDEDLIAVCQRIESWGGHVQIQRDHIDFWVPPAQQVLFELAYPELTAQRELNF